MLLAQITDLHIVGEDQLCQGRVATHAELQEAVAHINGLDPRPEVVLATGEIVPEVDLRIPCPIDLPEKDQPVFLAAISIQAENFLIGDITHLEEYFGKSVRGVKTCRVRDY